MRQLWSTCLSGTLCCAYLHIHADVVSQERACEADFDELHVMFRRRQRGLVLLSGKKIRIQTTTRFQCCPERQPGGVPASNCFSQAEPTRNYGTVTDAQKCQEHLPSTRVGHAPHRNKQSDRARYNLDSSF